MIRESEVREKLAAVKRGELSLESFERWLMPASWSMHRDSEPAAIELVSAIHDFFSQRDDRVLNESELHAALLSLLKEPLVFEVSIILPDPFHQASHFEPRILSASVKPAANIKQFPEIQIPLPA